MYRPSRTRRSTSQARWDCRCNGHSSIASSGDDRVELVTTATFVASPVASVLTPLQIRPPNRIPWLILFDLNHNCIRLTLSPDTNATIGSVRCHRDLTISIPKRLPTLAPIGSEISRPTRSSRWPFAIRTLCSPKIASSSLSRATQYQTAIERTLCNTRHQPAIVAQGKKPDQQIHRTILVVTVDFKHCQLNLRVRKLTPKRDSPTAIRSLLDDLILRFFSTKPAVCFSEVAAKGRYVRDRSLEVR